MGEPWGAQDHVLIIFKVVAGYARVLLDSLLASFPNNSIVRSVYPFDWHFDISSENPKAFLLLLFVLFSEYQAHDDMGPGCNGHPCYVRILLYCARRPR